MSIFDKVKALGFAILLLRKQNGLSLVGYWKSIWMVVRGYRQLKAGGNPRFDLSWTRIFPCTRDCSATTPLDPVYFYQDTWAAGKIFKARPDRHFDVGSAAKTVGIISQFVSTTMIDIRPIGLRLPGLDFITGSALDMPFASGSIASLSSLCVVEHIGLGRYGDPVDAFGSEKAASEFKRVLALGGNLYVSVPVDDQCRVYFNAHRAFTRDAVLELFDGLSLEEEKYQYGETLADRYDASRGFGTGLFHFRRNRG